MIYLYWARIENGKLVERKLEPFDDIDAALDRIDTAIDDDPQVLHPSIGAGMAGLPGKGDGWELYGNISEPRHAHTVLVNYHHFDDDSRAIIREELNSKDDYKKTPERVDKKGPFVRDYMAGIIEKEKFNVRQKLPVKMKKKERQELRNNIKKSWQRQQ